MKTHTQPAKTARQRPAKTRSCPKTARRPHLSPRRPRAALARAIRAILARALPARRISGPDAIALAAAALWLDSNPRPRAR